MVGPEADALFCEEVLEAGVIDQIERLPGRRWRLVKEMAPVADDFADSCRLNLGPFCDRGNRNRFADGSQDAQSLSRFPPGPTSHI